MAMTAVQSGTVPMRFHQVETLGSSLMLAPQDKTLHRDVRECDECFNSCFAVLQAPIAVYTSGKGSSAAGLTATVIKDSAGEFYLEVGAWYGGHEASTQASNNPTPECWLATTVGTVSTARLHH